MAMIVLTRGYDVFGKFQSSTAKHPLISSSNTVKITMKFRGEGNHHHEIP